MLDYYEPRQVKFASYGFLIQISAVAGEKESLDIVSCPGLVAESKQRGEKYEEPKCYKETRTWNPGFYNAM